MNINLTLLSQAAAFAIFIWFTAKFIWPPLLRAIETRQKQIADGLAAAERGRQDLEQASKRAADVLREARGQAQEVLAQADRRASQLVEEAKAQAKVEGDRIIAGAKAEIDREVFRAKEALRAQVAALAVQGAEKILRREVDAKAHAELLNAVAAEL
ncbi:MAG TPA: F0F1 ATP synthase subunit B [Burkholderiales bacterium]|jgi:F-type H+-transporting ATPase subunit b|nr:F0F1 ATP synthase subunit B [Burkholderiales bacterium]